jgi:hypothetical protein
MINVVTALVIKFSYRLPHDLIEYFPIALFLPDWAVMSLESYLMGVLSQRWKLFKRLKPA